MAQQTATQRLTEILSRINQLPAAGLEPPQFFAHFLQLSVAATGSAGGAIWVIQPEQPPQCYCHVDLDKANIQDPAQQQTIIEAVAKTVEEKRTLVLPPSDSQSDAFTTTAVDGSQGQQKNRCSHALFFKPLRAGQQITMILQVIGDPRLDPENYRPIVSILDQTADVAEKYLVHRRATVLDDDRKSLARLLEYAQGVHASLETDKVIFNVANLGRDAIGCDRIILWIDPQVKRGLRAVSGIDKPDRRAVLFQAAEKLSQHCLKINQPIIASRERLAELPEEEELTLLLRHYFNISQLNQIFLQPMVVEDGKPLGVLVVEGFEDQNAANLAGVISTVAAHGALAIQNALDVASLPLVRPFSKLKKKSDSPTKKRRYLIIAALILIALVISSIMPYPIEIDASCQLIPRERRMVDSPLEAVQIIEIVKTHGQVEPGEIVMRLNDDELKAQLYTREASLEQERAKLNQAAMTYGPDSTEVSLSQLQIERLQKEMTFITGQIDKCLIRSPIAGTILTDRLELKQGITVRKGDVLFEVADLQQWQLVLDVVQDELGWVVRGLEERDNPDAPLTIEYFLAAYPEYRLTTAMAAKDQISQLPQIKEEGNVYEIRVPVSAQELEPISVGLREGSVGRAKINTTERPLIYVLLRKVIRFFRVTFF